MALAANFTSGDVLRWRRVGGLTLAEVAFEGGQRVHRESHAHARFVLVISGSLIDTAGGEARTCGPSTLLFRSADEARSYGIGDTGAKVLVVDMDAAWVRRAREQSPLVRESTSFRGGLLLHLAHRLHGEFGLRDEVSRLVIESLALGILAEASRRVAAVAASPAIPLWLQLAMAFIEQHFAEPLPLTTVAKKVGVHPVHLARTFRRVHNTTFAAYVRQRRIEFARQELAGAAALSDIACAAGFCDQSHLSRCFKQHTGLTPAEYRIRLR
jgi:AraC family transcriptional regulator